eukprot:353415-Chlamydomonas_euryale.AAC.4
MKGWGGPHGAFRALPRRGGVARRPNLPHIGVCTGSHPLYTLQSGADMQWGPRHRMMAAA